MFVARFPTVPLGQAVPSQSVEIPLLWEIIIQTESDLGRICRLGEILPCGAEEDGRLARHDEMREVGGPPRGSVCYPGLDRRSTPDRSERFELGAQELCRIAKVRTPDTSEEKMGHSTSVEGRLL